MHYPLDFSLEGKHREQVAEFIEIVNGEHVSHVGKQD